MPVIIQLFYSLGKKLVISGISIWKKKYYLVSKQKDVQLCFEVFILISFKNTTNLLIKILKCINFDFFSNTNNSCYSLKADGHCGRNEIKLGKGKISSMHPYSFSLA